MKTWTVRLVASLLFQLGVYPLVNLSVGVIGNPSDVWADTIDVRDTKFGQKVCDTLDSYRVGNQGSTECSIVIDEDTGNIRGDLNITAHHVWTKVCCNANGLVDVGVKVTLGGYFIYRVQRREVLESQLKFEFGTLKAILGKSLDVGTITLDVQTFIDLIEGNLDIVELVKRMPGSPYPETVCERDAAIHDYTARYGYGNFYFASERFVKWADPIDRGLSWGTELVLTAGAAAGPIMQQVGNELEKESDSILSWLQAKGEQHAESLLVQLLTGERFTWPYVAAVWQPVKCQKRFTLFSRSWDALPMNHPAFALIWDWGKTQSLTNFLAGKGQEIYTDLTKEVFQQLYKRDPNAAELARVMNSFAQNGPSYATQLFDQATIDIYHKLYGQTAVLSTADLAVARTYFEDGLPPAAVEVMLVNRRNKRKALQFILTYYTKVSR